MHGVRINAVSLLATVPSASQRFAAARFDQAAKEFIAAQRFHADRPEAHAGEFSRAARIVTEYKAAFPPGGNSDYQPNIQKARL